MAELSQEVQNELEEVADNYGVDYDEVRENYLERLEDVQERATGVSDGMMKNLAMRQLQTRLEKNSSVPTDELEMLTIGGGARETSGGLIFTGSVLVDDGDGASLGSIFVNDSDEMVYRMNEAFDEVGNIITGEFGLDDSDKKGHVSVYSTEASDFDVKRPSPDMREELRDDIREEIPEVTIENIADNLSMTRRYERNDGSEGHAVIDSDVRRITAHVFDGYKNVDSGLGSYTVRDESVFDTDDVMESDVFDADTANENATPGLTCWTDPEDMEYGSESIIEFIGTLSVNDEGIVSMDVHGMIPIGGEEIQTDFDGYEDSEEEQDVERPDTGDVDRERI